MWQSAGVGPGSREPLGSNHRHCWREGPAEGAAAGLARQDGELAGDRVDQDILDAGTRDSSLVERRVVSVAAADHLRDEQLVAVEQRPSLADPPERLGMTGVAADAAVHGEDVPQSVQLAVLAEEVLTA